MEKNTHSLNWLALGAELIDCLRSKGNHRFTRYDAFVWMMEHIQKGVAVRDADGVVVNSAPYSASYKRLAEDWNWERHTVQSFIEELTALSVITSKRQGNVYVFSSARSLTNSLSYDFTFPTISPLNDSNATIKCVLQNLCELACCNSKTTCANDSLSNDFSNR